MRGRSTDLPLFFVPLPKIIGMKNVIYLFCFVAMLASCSSDDDLTLDDLYGTWVVENFNQSDYIYALQITNSRSCKVSTQEGGYLGYYDCDYVISGNELNIRARSASSDLPYFNVTILNRSESEMTCQWVYGHQKGKEYIEDGSITRKMVRTQ